MMEQRGDRGGPQLVGASSAGQQVAAQLQKRKALVTGLVLAAMALGVYLVLILQVAARA
jgi:hypothetical protein